MIITWHVLCPKKGNAAKRFSNPRYFRYAQDTCPSSNGFAPPVALPSN
jgi:hypothetical protein